MAERVAAVIRVAYFFPAFWLAVQALDWQRTAEPVEPELLWPLFWLRWFELSTVGPALFGTCVVAVLAGALFSEHFLARVLSFWGLLSFLALKFSLGKIHHLMHGWLLLLFVLLWLPRGWSTPAALGRRGRQELVLVFSAAQLLVATTYTLAGAGKILGGLYQLVRGEVTVFHPQSLARHIAARLLETNDVSLWGPWLIERGEWLWPLMMGTVYLQFFAIVFALRPRLHRLLGYGLVVFHVLAPLSLAIDFTPAIMLCGTLFVASPIAPEDAHWRAVLTDLPLVRYAHERWLGWSLSHARGATRTGLLREK